MHTVPPPQTGRGNSSAMPLGGAGRDLKLKDESQRTGGEAWPTGLKTRKGAGEWSAEPGTRTEEAQMANSNT